MCACVWPLEADLEFPSYPTYLVLSHPTSQLNGELAYAASLASRLPLTYPRPHVASGLRLGKGLLKEFP